jgi:hypothetical protein
MRAIGDTLNETPVGPGMEAGWRNVKGYQLNMQR